MDEFKRKIDDVINGIDDLMISLFEVKRIFEKLSNVISNNPKSNERRPGS